MKRFVIALSLIAVLCTAIVTVGYSDASTVKTELVSIHSNDDGGAPAFSVSYEFVCPVVYVFKYSPEFAPRAFAPKTTEKERAGFVGMDRAPPKVRFL